MFLHIFSIWTIKFCSCRCCLSSLILLIHAWWWHIILSWLTNSSLLLLNHVLLNFWRYLLTQEISAIGISIFLLVLILEWWISKLLLTIFRRMFNLSCSYTSHRYEIIWSRRTSTSYSSWRSVFRVLIPFSRRASLD